MNMLSLIFSSHLIHQTLVGSSGNYIFFYTDYYCTVFAKSEGR